MKDDRTSVLLKVLVGLGIIIVTSLLLIATSIGSSSGEGRSAAPREAYATLSLTGSDAYERTPETQKNQQEYQDNMDLSSITTTPVAERSDTPDEGADPSWTATDSAPSQGSLINVNRDPRELDRRHLTASPSEASNRSRRRGFASGSLGNGGQTETEDDPEYSSIRRYLADHDEQLSEVRDIVDILGNPSNIVDLDGFTSLMSWDARNEEPRGSYLYVLQQDRESHISQVHRYFCPERRLDILAENCTPIASVYSDSGVPVAVGYSEDGRPIENDARDLDPSMFSQMNAYIEANELLIFLQDYFDRSRV